MPNAVVCCTAVSRQYSSQPREGFGIAALEAAYKVPSLLLDSAISHLTLSVHSNQTTQTSPLIPVGKPLDLLGTPELPGL